MQNTSRQSSISQIKIQQNQHLVSNSTSQVDNDIIELDITPPASPSSNLANHLTSRMEGLLANEVTPSTVQHPEVMRSLNLIPINQCKPQTSSLFRQEGNTTSINGNNILSSDSLASSNATPNDSNNSAKPTMAQSSKQSMDAQPPVR